MIMRALVFATLLLSAGPALAQEQPAPPQTDLERASHMLAANWRPIVAGANAEAALANSCEGALEEMAALDAALPEELNADGLNTIRAQRGLIIVPTTENPAAVYVFPNPNLASITSGLAAVRVVDAAAGRISLIDAAGATTQFQLGVSGGQPMMRILLEGADPVTYVGCARSVG